jgi:2-C-methyl-D-erythritol 4-phosphate cytidylyltransferase
VVIHDAARPLVTGSLVQRVVEVARVSGAAVAALRVVDTLKRRTEGDGMVTTVDRENLWVAQTPQAFRVEVFREAVTRATVDHFIGTDDASLVERLGIHVSLVDGEPFNFKITRPQDVLLAEELLAKVRDRSTPASASVGEAS